MLNADVMLALLQWAMIGVGAAVCIGAVLMMFVEAETLTYLYTYPDGRTVEAVPRGGEDKIGRGVGRLMGFGAGLVFMTLGAMLFCLRRIGSFMGQMRDEMRQQRSEGI